MKISIIMPVYNDENLIASSINSVLSQTYTNWELLIMDDGSSDNTAAVINSINDKRIRLFQQKNSGQLVALNNLCQYITGDLVLMLHSDDRLYKNDSLEKNVKHFVDPLVDGIYCDIVQFFNSGAPDKTFSAPKIGKNGPKKLLTLLGSNFILDHFFIRRNVFETSVKVNYLKWYLTYWLNFKDDKVTSINLKYTKDAWYHYRVYEANYANSVIGNFELYFTRFRIIFFLSEYYTVPFPLIQKELTRRYGLPSLIINKRASNKHLGECIKANLRSMNQRTKGAFTLYFEILYAFYTKSSDRLIELKSPILLGYLPAETRKFFSDLQNNSLVPVYQELINQLKIGFKLIRVETIEDRKQLEEILKFMCIRAKVILVNEYFIK